MKSIVLVLLAFVLQVPLNVPKEEIWPKEFYVQQESSNSCTLSASVMLIRSCLLQGNNSSWQQVTESDVRNYAWTSEGLSWQWHYTIEGNVVSIAHRSVSNMDKEELKEILELHPEGILLYCGGTVHHGVLLLEYKDGIFYCADPADGFSGDTIRLSDSLLGNRVGTQEDILHHMTAYWYIDHSEIISEAAEDTE